MRSLCLPILLCAILLSAHADKKTVAYHRMPGVKPDLLSLDIHSQPGFKNAPVMVYVHGGGWQGGDKANVGLKSRFFNQQGYVFVSVNYRLSPAVQHPAHAQDVAKAVAWVHNEIARYGGNPERMFLMGHSAGAHLAALIGVDERWLKAEGKSLSIIKGVVLLDTAAYDLAELMSRGTERTKPHEQAFGKDPKTWRDASPIEHIHSGKNYPPFWLGVAERPFKLINVERFAKKLRDSGTRVEIYDATAFETHASINRDFGAKTDKVTQAVQKFLESLK
ncbi:MAG: alpha/beta hydrolase [Fimbriimonadia bacterium]|nr:alpha/beta hydrolase [Fimbriimonadia bacterium]